MQLPRQPVITFIRQMPMNIWSRKSCRNYCSSKRYCCLRLRSCKCCIAHRRNLVPVYNFAEEYRPKLYKRLRSFTWIDPIHETLRLEPVVFDSEIRIQHRPSPGHAKRDLEALAAAADREKLLSDKLRHMYAMELYLLWRRQRF